MTKSTRKKKATPARRRKTGPVADAAVEEISFETALERLEEIVHRLEEGEIPLEESIQAYAEGTALVRRCMEKLEAAETMIRELSESAEGFRLEASDLETDDGEEEEDEEAGEDEGGTGELPF